MQYTQDMGMIPLSVMKKCLIPSFEIDKKEVQLNFLFVYS